jgi:hypothetical protein
MNIKQRLAKYQRLADPGCQICQGNGIVTTMVWECPEHGETEMSDECCDECGAQLEETRIFGQTCECVNNQEQRDKQNIARWQAMTGWQPGQGKSYTAYPKVVVDNVYVAPQPKFSA